MHFCLNEKNYLFSFWKNIFPSEIFSICAVERGKRTRWINKYTNALIHLHCFWLFLLIRKGFMLLTIFFCSTFIKLIWKWKKYKMCRWRQFFRRRDDCTGYDEGFKHTTSVMRSAIISWLISARDFNYFSSWLLFLLYQNLQNRARASCSG